VTADAVEGSFADYKKTFGAEASAKFATLDAPTIKNTNAQIDKFIPKNAFYDPLAGLDKNLVANIKAIPACNIKDENQKDITQITAWYGPNSSVGANPYITTTCFGNTGKGRGHTTDFTDQITANYYYQEPNAKTIDAEVVNVLGVLVPKRFFKDHNSDNFAHTNWVNQSNPSNNASGGDDITVSGKYFVNLTTAINNQNSGYPSTISPANNSIFVDAKVVKVSRNNTQYDRNLSMPQLPSSIAGALELKTSFQQADWWGNVSSDGEFSNNFYTYMRTLDEKNVGYVWAIKNDMNRYYVTRYASNYFSFRMQLLCMTNDCKSDTGSLIYDKGRSAADTTISFTKGWSGGELLDSKLEVNGKTGF
jgi:hypothetical protein